jgi:hypothetical protein
MECSICYENFLDINETKYSCPTLNCKCIICIDCWIKFTHNGKNIEEMTENDMPNIHTYFKCPYCKQINWKYYMNNVFIELQQKVLGEEEFYEIMFKPLKK